MPFKIIIGDKGKAWRIESDSEYLVGKSVGDKIDGNEIKKELEGYELEITGGSDIAGFPMNKNISGIGLKGVLLKKGWGMHDSRSGVRIRKTNRGKVISNSVVQINMKVLKEGKNRIEKVFPEQNKSEEIKKTEEKKEDGEVKQIENSEIAVV